MGTRYYLTSDYAPDGVALKVIERDGNGQLLNEYKGYRNSRKGTYTLYPIYNPFASNSGRKHVVSDRLVRYPEVKNET